MYERVEFTKDSTKQVYSVLLYSILVALDELARVGFHLLHPIASRDHLLHEHLHVWCSPGARALCRSSEAETIQSGLMHPMIPKGSTCYNLSEIVSLK